MNVLSQIISENLINAIGWTILHSIWQGAAIALGFALLMFFLRRYSSRTRYFVGAMALLLVLGISLTTFLNIYDPGTSINMTAAPAASLEPALAGTIQNGNLYQQGIFSTFSEYFKRHLPLIVTLWFLGILVLVLKLAGGFLYNQRVKAYNTRPLNKSWQNHFRKLCRKSGIKKGVALLESALVKVPMTIGHLKPVILLPAGMVTGLPRDQVEALLAHELAHILRKDYLVNIMQNVIDILYFYHPGVRWISSHVRTERENCCDDIAVSLSGDSINFARALTNIDGSLVKNASPALTAVNKSTKLFGRIKRLFAPRKKSSEFSEGFVGACILALFIFTLVVSADAAAGLNRDTGKAGIEKEAIYDTDDDKKEEQAKKEAELKKREQARVQRQEEKANREEKREERARTRVEEKEERKRVEREEKRTRVEREEKRTRGEREAKRTREERKEREKIREALRKMERELRVIEGEKIAKLEIELKRKAEALKVIDKARLAKLKQELQKKAEIIAKIEKAKLAKLEQEFKKKAKGLNAEDKEKLAKLELELKKKAELLEKISAEKLLKLEQELAQRAGELESAERKKLEHLEQELKMRAEDLGRIDKEKLAKLEKELAAKVKALKEQAKEFEKQEEEFEKQERELKKEAAFFNDLKKDLKKDKLIDDEKDFEFKLTPKGLWVNGKKQSKTLFKKYKKIYEAHTGKKLKDVKKFQIINKK